MRASGYALTVLIATVALGASVGASATASPLLTAPTGLSWEMIVYALAGVAFWLVKRALDRQDRDLGKIEARFEILQKTIADEHINRNGIKDFVSSAVAIALNAELKPLVEELIELRTELRLLRHSIPSESAR